MNITIVEHGPLGLHLARTLSRRHRVHLLRSQEATTDEPPETLGDAAVNADDPSGGTGLTVTDANHIAFSRADHIIVTPPVEYGGRHERYNALLCEATLNDALSYNATASVAVQCLVPVGFTDRLSRECAMFRLVHTHQSPPSTHSTGRSDGDRGMVVLGGPRQEATRHSELLREAMGDHFRHVLVDRATSETVALLAATLNLAAPQAIRQVTEHAQKHGLHARVLIECLGLLKSVRSAADTPFGTTQPAPLDGHTRRAC